MSVEVEELWMSAALQEQVILVCSIVSILFGLFNVWKVLSVQVHSFGRSDDLELQDAGQATNESIEN